MSNLAIIDWNNRIRVKCMGKDFYGLLDTSLLRRNNVLYKLVGKDPKYKDAGVQYCKSPERFHFERRSLARNEDQTACTWCAPGCIECPSLHVLCPSPVPQPLACPAGWRTRMRPS